MHLPGQAELLARGPEIPGDFNGRLVLNFRELCAAAVGDDPEMQSAGFFGVRAGQLAHATTHDDGSHVRPSV